MALFGRKGSLTGNGGTSTWSFVPVDPRSMSAPEGIDVDALRELPIGEGDLSTSGEFYQALQLALEGNVEQGVPALQALVDAPNPADAWWARVELGTIFMDHDIESRELHDGLGMLVSCLQAPYLDVVHNAAWNISEILRINGSPEAHRGYAELAIALGNPLSMVVMGERAMERGDTDEAREMWQKACDTIPRTQVLRTRAEVALTNLWLESADEQVRTWFIRARGSLPAQVWDNAMSLYIDNGPMFNVEGGSAGIATQYFPECPVNCTIEPITIECPHCGRNPRTLLHAAAGNGDGVYPVFALFGGDDSIGAITVFKDALDDLGTVNTPYEDGFLNASRIGQGSTLGQLLSAAAPMVLGTLDVTDRLLFSDASRSVDDSDYTVDIEVPAGQYTVVVWVSLPTAYGDTALRPLALAAVGGQLRDAVRDCVPALSDEDRAALIEKMWGDPNLLVNSHIANARVALAQGNYDADAERDADRALSWFLQLAEFEDAGTYELLQSLEPFDDAYLRRLLAARGIMNPTLPWRQAAAGGTTPAGLGSADPELRARADQGDIFAWNDLGYNLVHEGKIEEGLDYLARSAREGVPWAMASYSWALLLKGDHQRALALFDEVLPAMEGFVQRTMGHAEIAAIAPGQLANARSNAALSRLALGGAVQEALDVWAPGRWTGHVESKFYPAVVALRDGRQQDAESIAASLTGDERAEIIETLHQVIDEGTGWFADWCRDGLTILGNPPRAAAAPPTTASATAASEARFCTNCGAQRQPGTRFCTSCGSAF